MCPMLAYVLGLPRVNKTDVPHFKAGQGKEPSRSRARAGEQGYRSSAQTPAVADPPGGLVQTDCWAALAEFLIWQIWSGV